MPILALCTDMCIDKCTDIVAEGVQVCIDEALCADMCIEMDIAMHRHVVHTCINMYGPFTVLFKKCR